MPQNMQMYWKQNCSQVPPVCLGKVTEHFRIIMLPVIEQNWLQAHRVHQIDWPARSPDLNPSKIFGME